MSIFSLGGNSVKIASVLNYIVTGVCTGFRFWKMQRVLCNPSAAVWLARKKKCAQKAREEKTIEICDK
jgi:hypothetical protein